MSPGVGNDNPLQYPCLGNLWGARWATVPGVSESDTDEWTCMHKCAQPVLHCTPLSKFLTPLVLFPLTWYWFSASFPVPSQLQLPRYFCPEISVSLLMGFPGGLAGKQSTSNTGDLGSISGLGRSPGEGKGYPLQYSGLENSGMGSQRVVHNWVTFISLSLATLILAFHFLRIQWTWIWADSRR